MADRYLLESGTPDGYTLEQGGGVLILEGSGEYFSAVRDLTNCFRNVRDRSLYAGMGYAEAVGEYAPDRHNWDIDSFRPLPSIHYQRDTNPTIGWLAQEPVVVFDPQYLSWMVDSQHPPTSLRYQRDTNTETGWLQFAPDIQSWPIPSSCPPTSLRYRRDTNQETGWNQYNPEQTDWPIDSQRVANTPVWPDTTPRLDWLAGDVAVSSWTIAADRMAPLLHRWTPDSNLAPAWFPLEAPPPVFDPAIQSWTVDSQRVVLPPGQPSGDIAQLTQWVFDPQSISWVIPSVLLATSRRYHRDSHQETGWNQYTPDQLPWVLPSFLPKTSLRYQREAPQETGWTQYVPLHVSWVIDSQRLRATSSWRSSSGTTDWITEGLSAGTPFDATLFPAIAELAGDRTAQADRLQVGLYLGQADLSWVHDVIPLTDPPPDTVLRLRPIAPIMSARRRNKRRP